MLQNFRTKDDVEMTIRKGDMKPVEGDYIGISDHAEILGLRHIQTGILNIYW